MSEFKEVEEVAKNYFCECCQYQAKTKYNFERHLLSKKHVKKSNGEETSSIEEPKIKRTRRTKKIMSAEMETQTDSDEETIFSDFTIEYLSESINNVESSTQTDFIDDENISDMYDIESKNSLLEDEVNELKYELEDKIKENEQMECKYIEKINNLEIKTQNEINEVISEKHLLSDRIQDLEEENEKKDKTIKELMEIIDNLKQSKSNIKMIIEDELTTESKQILTEENEATYAVENEETYNVEKNIIKKIDFIENEYLTEENYNKILDENRMLMNDNEKLEEENESLKLQLAHKDINVNAESLKTESIKKSNKKSNKKNDTQNPMNIYKQLCHNPLCNDMIINNSTIDRCNGNAIKTTQILKSVNLDSYSENPADMYKKIFKSIIKEMKSKNIDFIKCIDTKRKKFEIYDGSEWKKYDSQEFENVILNLIGGINSSIINCITNTSNLDDYEFKKIYKITKELYHDCDKGTKQSIILATFNPIYDDKCNYIKVIKILCSEIFKMKKSNKKKSKYQDDSDSDSDNSDSDSDDDEDDDED